MTQNIYQQLGLKQVINACGKMTILGVSSVAPEVMQATARAASSFVEIDQLVDKTGELVSRFTGAEDSYVTSCASAGIAIAVAAAITRGDKARVALMPDSSGMANEVVMLRGHNVDYGASILSAIRLGGGRVVEVGSSNLAALWQLESAITDATAALLYVKSHHCVQKGMFEHRGLRTCRADVQPAADCRCRRRRGFTCLGGERSGYGGLQRRKSL